MSLFTVPKTFNNALDLWGQLQKELVKSFNTTENRLDGLNSLSELNVEPVKPVDYKLYFADGTNWNPGSGRGVYCYDPVGPTWRHLG